MKGGEEAVLHSWGDPDGWYNIRGRSVCVYVCVWEVTRVGECCVFIAGGTVCNVMDA